MKNQKGLIQIPLLIAIIAGVLVVGGVGYFGVKQYQNYRTEITEKEKQAQLLLEAQQRNLEQAELEIEKLKIENKETQEKQSALEKKLNQEKVNTSKVSIQPQELSPYLTGVQDITCYGVGGSFSKGSGSLWILDGNYVVLTNEHVVEGARKCELGYDDENNVSIGFYGLDLRNKYSKNVKTDSAIIPIKFDPSVNPNVESVPLSKLNYKISTLRKCKAKMPIGSQLVLIGYPAYARKEIGGDGGWIQYQAITNGIVSGYDNVLSGEYTNYLVSAKIDSGNSGGISFSKDESGLCTLGIPTWVTFGNYETQGTVQNIHNVLPE